MTVVLSPCRDSNPNVERMEHGIPLNYWGVQRGKIPRSKL
jgi:hypothetical protein